MATSGSRKPRNETKDGNGSRAVVNSLQEEERVLSDRVLDVPDRAVDGADRGQQHEQHDEMHARAVR